MHYRIGTFLCTVAPKSTPQALDTEKIYIYILSIPESQTWELRFDLASRGDPAATAPCASAQPGRTGPQRRQGSGVRV